MLSSVLVFGHTFEVELVVGLEDNGDTDIDKRKIRISADLSEADQWEFLFHEITHAALNLAGVADIIGEPAEEGVCRAIQYGLWPTISGLLQASKIEARAPRTRRTR